MSSSKRAGMTVTQLDDEGEPVPKPKRKKAAAKPKKPAADLVALSKKAHDALAKGDAATYSSCKAQALAAGSALLSRDEVG